MLFTDYVESFLASYRMGLHTVKKNNFSLGFLLIYHHFCLISRDSPFNYYEICGILGQDSGSSAGPVNLATWKDRMKKISQPWLLPNPSSSRWESIPFCITEMSSLSLKKTIFRRDDWKRRDIATRATVPLVIFLIKGTVAWDFLASVFSRINA